MDNRDRFPLAKKIKYLLDDFISKGFWAQVLLLAGTAISLTLIFGIIAMKFGKESYVEGYWASLMHMIDQGTITADERGTDAYFLFMLIVTFIGMAFTSTIIALISSAIQGKLNELKKGHSAIIEKDHVVVLGFDENAYTICQEMIRGTEIEGERICLVIADDVPKEEMEHGLKAYQGGQQQGGNSLAGKLKNSTNIRVVFRSGDPSYENTLKICDVSRARAVVVNRENDLDTIRILLALASYLKKNDAYLDNANMPNIVATIHNKDNLSAAMAAAEICADETGPVENSNQDRIQIILDERIQESLLAKTCVQQGFPAVAEEIFTYTGSSLFVERESKVYENGQNPFIGKTLREISEMLKGAIPIGFFSNEIDKPTTVRLNPTAEDRYQKEDCLVYLSKRKNLFVGKQEQPESKGVFITSQKKEKESLRNFLIIGRNDLLPGMLENVSDYCIEGSSVNVIASEFRSGEHGPFVFHSILCDDPYSWSNVKKILDENSCWFDSESGEKLTNIVLLSQEGADKYEADEKVIVLLLNIRQYLKLKGQTDISITSEMRLPRNQILLQTSNSNDFVVTSEITNRMIAQVTDDPRKHYLIDELLCQKNCGIELNPITDYVDVSQEFNFAGVFRSAGLPGAENGDREIPLGWIRLNGETGVTNKPENRSTILILNPTNEQLQMSYPGGNYDDYRLVVLSSRLFENL